MYTQAANASVLLVCIEQPNERDGRKSEEMTSVESGREAIELLGVLDFDLLVTGTELPDMSFGEFIRRVRRTWPYQRWAVIARPEFSAADEIKARSLGAAGIFDTKPDEQTLLELAEAIHSRLRAPPDKRFSQRKQLSFAATKQFT